MLHDVCAVGRCRAVQRICLQTFQGPWQRGSVNMDTWSQREAGLGYMEVDLLFLSLDIFSFVFFFSSLGSMSVSLGWSYEYCFCLGLCPFL